MSSMQMGTYLGQVVVGTKMLGQSFYPISFLLLTESFIAMCFVNRFSIMLFLLFCIGFFGSILSGVSINLESNNRNSLFIKKPNNNELSKNLEWNIICFMFSVLISGYLYDDRTYSHFTLYYIALTLASFCIFIVVYYILINQFVTRQKIKFSKGLQNSIEGNKSIGSTTSGKKGNNKNLTKPNPNSEEPLYEGPVPPNFLSACRGDRNKAQKMYGRALQWRRDLEVDGMLTVPQQHFHSVLQYYPHAIHGYSLDGCAVVYENLGKGNPRALKAAGVSVEQLLWHFQLRNELVFEKLLAPEKLLEITRTCAEGAVKLPEDYQRYLNLLQQGGAPTSVDGLLLKPVPRLMTVLDVEGISLSGFNADVINFIKLSGEIIDNYYPEQVARLVICKAPRWFSSIWMGISRVLPESVLKKIDILYDLNSLDKYIHRSQRPESFGGTDVPLGQAEGHLAFLQLEKDWKVEEVDVPVKEENKKLVSNNNQKRINDTMRTEGLKVEENRGFMGWVRSRFSKVPTAFLGEKNSYRFNQHTQSWDFDVDAYAEHYDSAVKQNSEKKERRDVILEDNEDDNNSVNSAFLEETIYSENPNNTSNFGKMSESQLEEHGLVLAIHAAHLASSYGKGIQSEHNSSHNDLEGQQEGRPARFERQHSGNNTRNLSSSCSNILNNAGTMTGLNNTIVPRDGIPPSKVSSHIFLIVIALYLISLCVQNSILTLVPVWLVSPVTTGGLGYGVRDTALVMSAAGLVVLNLHIFLHGRLDFMLKASPVRALRIGCGLLALLCFLLPIYVSNNTGLSHELLDQLHHSDSPSKFIQIFAAEAKANPLVLFSAAVEQEKQSGNPQHQLSPAAVGSADHSNSPNHLFSPAEFLYWYAMHRPLPSRSLFSLHVPALALGLLVCALYIIRKSAGVLLHLTLSASFQSPAAMRYVLNGLIDVCTPIISCLVYTSIYRLHLRYPMDSSCFFAGSACAILLVYIGSIVLTVQFRGDYGVMTDYREPSQLNSSQQNSGRMMESGSPVDFNMFQRSRSGNIRNSDIRGKDGIYADNGSMGARRSNNEFSTQEDIFCIPSGDLSLLMTPGASGYGSKLYNLKDDFKDL